MTHKANGRYPFAYYSPPSSSDPSYEQENGKNGKKNAETSEAKHRKSMNKLSDRQTEDHACNFREVIFEDILINALLLLAVESLSIASKPPTMLKLRSKKSNLNIYPKPIPCMRKITERRLITAYRLWNFPIIAIDPATMTCILPACQYVYDMSNEENEIRRC